MNSVSSKTVAPVNFQCQLLSSDKGYLDYNVIGHPIIKRACPYPNIKNGDIFNVYYIGVGRKIGVTWVNSIEESIQRDRLLTDEIKDSKNTSLLG